MRLLPLAALSLILLSTSTLCAAAPKVEGVLAEPIRAAVASPGAPVRSGPADSYYLTDTLPEGATVEVYKQNDDGWCAVRPPEDSFSWVFAQNVRLINDDLAEITKDEAAARVGSRLSSQRDVVQVRMKQGERVAILGQDDRDGGVWYKIAPPAGEFRWMKARDLGLEPSTPKSADAAAAVTTTDERYAVRTVAVEQTVAGEEAAPIAAPPLAPVTTMPVATTPAPLPKPTDQWTPAKSPIPTGDITPIAGAPAAAVPTAPASTAEIAARLQQLELQLSRMVAEQPATWNIAPLEQSAEQLLASAQTIEDRTAVKATLAKIDKFSSIQRRYAATPIAAPAAGIQSGMPQQPIASMTPTSAAPVTGNAPNSPYDAVGILRPVVSKRPGAPQFALVNAQGQVLTFITPTPDVNLQPFVGQQIGVTGSRGYIPEFRRAHVTAARVSPLNDRMVR